MKIAVSKHSGFCFGVRRAVDMALKEAECNDGNVYTLGPIIHNSFVVEELASKGVVAVESVDDVDNGVLVIRSHGVGEAVYKKAEQKGLHLVDATCPYVKKIHQLVAEYSEKGYTVIIVGKADHPEVIGIMGWATCETFVLYDFDEIQNIPFDQKQYKFCVVAQTTCDAAHFKKMAAAIKERAPETLVFNTVCAATAQRQQAAEELSGNADMMVVIGDKKSSNTKRLYELCKKHCDNTIAVESAANVINISEGIESIGIVAGASTPDWVIKEVIERMTEEQKIAEATEVVAEAQVAETVAEEATMEDFEKSMVKLRNGQYVKGTVISVTDDAAYVNLGYKADGIIPKSEFKLADGEKLQNVVAAGDEVEVEVVQVNDGDGNVILSRKPILERAAWAEVINVKENDEVVTIKVTETVKGGVLGTYGTFRVFVPASHLAVNFVQNTEAFVGKELKVKFIDVEPKAKRIVASRKIVLVEERAKKEAEFWDTHKEGDIIKGKIKNITPFGAFVDMGVFDGLIHISELAWGNVKSVADVVSVGEEVEAKITKIDKEHNKISLNRRTLLTHPWETVSERYAEGDVVTAKVIRLTEFGAILLLEPHIDAMIHISQISRKRVEKVEDVLAVGDVIEGKIVTFEPEKRRISISKKALEPKPEKPVAAEGERKPKADRPEGAKKKKAPKADRQESSSVYTKEDMTINLGDFFPQEMLDEIREAEKN